MSKKARTPIIEYDDHYAIELPGDHSPQERDRLSDQALVVAYDLRPGLKPRWRLRALRFDRSEWTRTGIRRWWAAHALEIRHQSSDAPYCLYLLARVLHRLPVGQFTGNSPRPCPRRRFFTRTGLHVACAKPPGSS